MGGQQLAIVWQRHIDTAGAAAEHAIVGPYTLIAFDFAATLGLADNVDGRL